MTRINSSSPEEFGKRDVVTGPSSEAVERSNGSACASCRDPGYCCKRLMLGGVTEKAFPTIKDARAIAAAWPFEPHGLPFLPMRVVQGHWLFTCPRLDWETGLCRDYENRPQLCRNYEPKSDPLCAMYEPKTAAIAKALAQ